MRPAKRDRAEKSMLDARRVPIPNLLFVRNICIVGDSDQDYPSSENVAFSETNVQRLWWLYYRIEEGQKETENIDIN